MNVVLIGPGAIGCLFGARLARAGVSICLLDKDPARARQLCQQGIHLLPLRGDPWTQAIQATARADALSFPDFVILCVKAYDTTAALEPLRSLLQDVPVVSLQNGIGNAEAVRALATEACVVCAVTGEGALLESPGRVHHTGSGITRIAPFTPEAGPAAAHFADILRQAGFSVERHESAPSILWGKVVVNAALNPAGAIWGLANGEIPGHPVAGPLALAAAREAAAVAARLGIPLPFTDPAEAVREVSRATSGNRSSMYEDIRLGRKTEIDAINGRVVEAASRLGVEAPANRDFLAQIHALESGRRRQSGR